LVQELIELLVGREMSAACMVRDYVEFHFDGPIVRALTDPRGRWGEWTWHFPEDRSAEALRLYIGLVVTNVVIREDEWFALDFGPESILVPLDDHSRVGPEALHVVGTNEAGNPTTEKMWIW
jgi:hypothetical protein